MNKIDTQAIADKNRSLNPVDYRKNKQAKMKRMIVEKINLVSDEDDISGDDIGEMAQPRVENKENM